MSESDQDAIIGRTLREYSAAKKELASLHAEAESIGYHLATVGDALRTKHSFTDSFTTGGNRIEIPDRERLLELSGQINTTTANKERLARLLKDAGYPPAAD